ncbi:MAG TPA: ubiquinol-cytochrome C chaperone family protein [Xanthobacteraceae bacterium]|nr:ubiquinol-cytochrome C chaperone family protein [Xanthobacteraceae bacterium]
MKFDVFRLGPETGNIAALYGAIVAQARSPAFYRDHGIPDTPAGRLEMILLHTWLLCRRLGRGPRELQKLGQQVFDFFCRDMDNNLREMGIGDLAVPRHMRRIGEAFYGRAAAYDRALASADEGALADALARNVFSGASQQSGHVRWLTAYVLETAGALAREQDSTLMAGRIDFPATEAPAMQHT